MLKLSAFKPTRRVITLSLSLLCLALSAVALKVALADSSPAPNPDSNLLQRRRTSSRKPAPEQPKRQRPLSYTDIAHAYHGMLLDKDFKEIKLDKATIERLQDSLLESLSTAPDIVNFKGPRGKTIEQLTVTPPLNKERTAKVLNDFKFADDERFLVKSALIQQGIDTAPAEVRPEYQWRFDLIHERALQYVKPQLKIQRPDLTRFLDATGLAAIVGRLRMPPGADTEYITTCRANDVPIPPNWPGGAGWVNRRLLPFEFNFLESGENTEVWTFEAPSDQGLCYALPRKDGEFVRLVGIICQSKRTGKACFWDNIDAETGTRIEGVGISLDIARLKDGSNLAENCTVCHRGGNVFLIHPETPLGAPLDREPLVRYEPIGQATWSNPPPLAALGTGTCSACHEIADPTSPSMSFCRILSRAADRTMPGTARPAGWDSPLPAYAAHISFFKTRCP